MADAGSLLKCQLDAASLSFLMPPYPHFPRPGPQSPLVPEHAHTPSLPSSPPSSLSGLTKSSELPQFRSTHSIALKKAETGRRPAPPLPSDHDPRHTYGLPGTFRNAQTQREKGPYEAPMKHLMQVGEGA